MSDHPSSTNEPAGHVPDAGHTESRPMPRRHAAARGRAAVAVVATGAVGGFVGYFIGGGLDDRGTGGSYRGGFDQGSFDPGSFDQQGSDGNSGSVSNGAVPGPSSGSVQGPSTSTRGS